MAKETVPKDILDKLNAGIEITGTDVDIRDLTSASDSVEVKQSTASNLKTEIYNPAGSALSIANYIYDGSIWQPITGNSSGAQKTFFEWLADNGTKIGGYDTGSSSGTTIYTVPAGKIAYITSMTCGFVGGVIVSGARAKLIVGGVDSLVHYTVANESDVAQGSPPITSNPVIPIKLTAGQTVEVITSSGDLLAYGCFTGYQINA